MKEQKAKEAYQFKIFSRQYFGDYIDFKQPKEPEPDIVFINNELKIGCEITTIHLDQFKKGGSNKKRIESDTKRLGDEIEILIREKFPKNYIINFHYNERNFGVKKISLVSADIANYLISKIIVLDKNKNTGAYYKETISHVNISGEIDCMIEYIDRNFRTYISLGHGAIIPQIKYEVLYPFIFKKNEKIKGYKNHYSSLWLLLVSQEDLSSDFELRDASIFREDQFNWQKIFILRLLENRYIELK